MGSVRHLVRRFVGSLCPGGPGDEANRWVAAVLTGPEYVLWQQLSGPDRRHSHQVARDVQRELGPQATTPVLAAALLHDVGKLRSRLRTPGRVVATVLASIAGRESIRQWSTGSGYRSRLGQYLDHPAIGVAMLNGIGSDPMVVAWAGQHHQPPTDWTLDPRLAAVLSAVDDD